MKIELLDLKAQYATIKDEIDKVVSKVIESQYFILSEEVSVLEDEVAVYSGVKYGAGVGSGTDALILALRALDIGPGDKVITTPFTFFATAESISSVGAEPVFVDIDPETYNIDPEKIKEYMEGVKGQGSAVKAIMPVHIYGQCADMTKIMEIAGEYGLKVIEDCAQAIGATHKGKKAGSFGDAGCFSFFPSKNLGGFGDGGMVVSDDEGFIRRVKKLRVHGSDKQYIHDEMGYTSRLDSLQAAILRVKLCKLDSWLEGRRSVAKEYDNRLLPVGIKIPYISEENIHTYHQYTIYVDGRDKIIGHLKEKGIPARVYYPVPMHMQPAYKDLGYKKGDLPVSEEMSDNVFSIPVYPELTLEQQKYITDVIAECIEKSTRV